MASAAPDGMKETPTGATETQSYVRLLESRVADLETRLADLELRVGGRVNVERDPAATVNEEQEEGKAKSNGDNKSDSKKDPKESPRVRTVENSLYNGQRRDMELAEERIHDPKETRKCAFIFRKVMTSDNKFHHSEVDILSRGLTRLLAKHITHFPTYIWKGNLIRLVAPFAPLVYEWNKLVQIYDPEYSGGTYKELVDSEDSEDSEDSDESENSEDSETSEDSDKSKDSDDSDDLDMYRARKEKAKRKERAKRKAKKYKQKEKRRETVNRKETIRDSPREKRAKDDLKLLLTYIAKCDELVRYFDTRDSNIKLGLVTFDTMWTLFAPGAKVFATPYMDTPQTFEVESPHTTLSDMESLQNLDAAVSPTARSSEDNKSSCRSIICCGLDFDGIQIVRVPYEFRIPKFLGARAITSLPCYPIEYLKYDEQTHADSKVILRKSLKSRGKKFQRLTQSNANRMFLYMGPILSEGFGIIKSSTKEQDGDFRLESKTGPSAPKAFRTEGPIIVDFYSYLHYGPGEATLGQFTPSTDLFELCQCEECTERRDPVRRNRDGYDSTLFPPRVLGYSLRQKMWAQFSIENITNSVWADGVFDKLILDEEYKRMIRAFISSHGSQKRKGRGDEPQYAADVIEGKGQGLVLLLHGPPGCGKTLTAESIAETSKRPLLAVNVADIGLNAIEAEKNLEKVFLLASLWDAVLLLDEADVFLEARREANDANRNALVSVLLRVLEYYTGIMILTTNRISSFDPAAQSRIHFALKYPPLNIDQKIQIFEAFLRQLHYNNLLDDYESIKTSVGAQIGQQKLNGRQIRNIVSSAKALADHESRKVNGEDFEAMIDATIKFQDQIDEINKQTRQEAGYKYHV